MGSWTIGFPPTLQGADCARPYVGTAVHSKQLPAIGSVKIIAQKSAKKNQEKPRKIVTGKNPGNILIVAWVMFRNVDMVFTCRASSATRGPPSTGCCLGMWTWYLHAVLLLPLEVLLPQGVDTVNHDLDQLDLGVSQSVLVGDVVGVTRLAAGLSPGASGLDGELLAPGLQLVNALLGPAGKVNVHGGAHASS